VSDCWPQDTDPIVAHGLGRNGGVLVQCWLVAGLNSTPALIGMTMFLIYLQALNVTYIRSGSQRDKKGQVSRMKNMTMKFSGRKLAASLASVCPAVTGFAGLCGGSG